jgi:hypothetical protein
VILPSSASFNILSTAASSGFTSTIKYVGVNEIISDTRMKVDQPAEKINRHIRSIRQEPTDIRFVPRC